MEKGRVNLSTVFQEEIKV